jgi:hypothetical protein
MLLAALLVDVVALVGGKVHTLVPGAEPAPATVVIEGDTIRAVEPGAAVPSGCRVIEIQGLHVIPGLIDGLAFHDPEHDVLHTAAGVTLLRDHGNELARIFDERELARRDAAGGPALDIAGAVIDGDPPVTDAAALVRRAVEVKPILGRLVEQKVDFVAFHRNLDVESFRELCKQAHEQKLEVWGPRLEGLTLQEALEAGQDGFLSLDALLPKGRSWTEVTPDELEAAVKPLVGAGAALVPQMRAFASRMEDPGDSAPELALLGPGYASMWRLDLAQRRQAITEDLRRRYGVVIGKQRSFLLALHRAGVALVPGSGAPHPWLMPGDGLISELVEWQSVGIPAGDCLAFATREAAKALGVAERRGTIEAGKLADLVIVRGDPSADVASLRSVEGVVLRGKWIDRATLDQALANVRATAAKANELAAKPIEVEPPSLPEGKVLMSGRHETVTAAGPVAAERWAVVKEVDGMLTFCGRRHVLGTGGSADSSVESRLRVKDGAFESFEIGIASGGRKLVVRGIPVAGRWRVERRLDDVRVDLKSAVEPLAAVDCGSLTTFLMLAQTRSTGGFPVMRFDVNLEPEVVRWDLAFDENGDHAFKTPFGLSYAKIDKDTGAIAAMVEQLGAGAASTNQLELDLHGGKGLPIPESKLRKAREAKAANEKSGK